MATIQVDEETKKKLLEIAGQLQSKLKRNITFNDAIEYLINENRSKPLEDLTRLFGILKAAPQDTRDVFHSLREEGEQRLERLTG